MTDAVKKNNDTVIEVMTLNRGLCWAKAGDPKQNYHRKLHHLLIMKDEPVVKKTKSEDDALVLAAARKAKEEDDGLRLVDKAEERMREEIEEGEHPFEECKTCKIPYDKRNCSLCVELHDVPPTP